MLYSSLFFLLLSELKKSFRKDEVLTLERCVEIALKRHPSIMAAQGNVDVFYARKGQAEAGYYPQVDASGRVFTVSAFNDFNRHWSTIGVAGRVSTSHSFDQYSTGIYCISDDL